MRLAARVVVCTLACAAVGFAAAPARAALEVTSSNWAGYAAHADGVEFTHVVGTWAQPKVACRRGASTFSSFWVGLGGYADDSSSLEQTGTDASCRRGRAVYSAWYELLPDPAIPVSMPVAPGQTITAEVVVDGANVTLTLENLTTGASFSKTVAPATVDTSSAEWIAEAPSVCSYARRCRTLPLANFGAVAFSGASATGNGQAGVIVDDAWAADPIVLGRRLGRGALPSALGDDSASFTVTTTAARRRRHRP
jgi:Peptidase A4 family